MTEKLAAFRAAYADFKLIKTRKVVQICLELPLELAGQALDVLGGMPNPASEVWCAVARLKEEKEVFVEPVKNPDAPPKPLNPTVQQFGIVCREKSFWRYLEAKGIAKRPIISSDDSAQIVRDYLDVNSRADIDVDDPKALALLGDYRAWMREPGVVG